MSVVDPVSSSQAHRRSMRVVAAGLAAGIAVLYLVLFLILLPHLAETDNPAPVFAVLAVSYAVLSLLLAKRDERLLHVVGAVVQAFLVGGYVWLFASSAVAHDEWFFLEHLLLGVVTAVAQVVLGVVLVGLARSGGPTRARSPDG
ncbi:MAG TPA: hypothetical protein VFI44_05620 [Ornithinibacter sp.]|nr:hypothetical protein [Ornithinibacter sp.]